jgi:glycosyltransferase involved in cell wall biosynthesis
VTIHLIYPHQNKISTPNVIGYRLIQALSKNSKVIAYDWDEFKKIKPNPGDILIGHLHPAPFTIMKRSLQASGWRKKIILQPYAEDKKQIGYIEGWVECADLFLAITGGYWFDRVETSAFSQWKSKMRHMDLAINPDNFPRVKRQFNPKGKRKFVYIGKDLHFKNLDFLEKLAQANTDTEFHWIGVGPERASLIKHGFVDFASEAGRELVSQFDFMITVGNADANPTTILESLGWGLIPVCTPTSGYVNEPGIVNIPLNDVGEATKVICHLQKMESQDLHEMQDAGRARVASHYNWRRFEAQVLDAIAEEGSTAQIKALSSPSQPLLQLLLYTLKAAVNNFRYLVRR